MKIIKKYGKRIVLDLKDNKSFFPTGFLYTYQSLICFICVLFGIFNITYILHFFLGESCIIFFVLLLTFLFVMNRGILNFFKYNFPNYVIFVRGNEKLKSEDILEHELFHLKIIEKGSSYEELNRFMNEKFDELTLELSKKIK